MNRNIHRIKIRICGTCKKISYMWIRLCYYHGVHAYINLQLNGEKLVVYGFAPDKLQIDWFLSPRKEKLLMKTFRASSYFFNFSYLKPITNCNIKSDHGIILVYHFKYNTLTYVNMRRLMLVTCEFMRSSLFGLLKTLTCIFN